MSPKSLHSWLKLNADYGSIWPHIAVKRESPADAKEFDGVPNKLEQFFLPNPGQGDEMSKQRDDHTPTTAQPRNAEHPRQGQDP